MSEFIQLPEGIPTGFITVGGGPLQFTCLLLQGFKGRMFGKNAVHADLSSPLKAVETRVYDRAEEK